MTTEQRSPETTGLMFFGQVSASISHEIKNALAIINENAGLLEDLVHMAEKGVLPDTERLERLAETVRRQVRRADGIVRKMNLFSHSADRMVEKVDLYDATAFVADLCARLIERGGLSLKVVHPDAAVGVHTHRFYLQNLLWACIAAVIEASGPGADLAIHFEKTTGGARVKFCAAPAPRADLLAGLFSGEARTLFAYLRAEPMSGMPGGEIGIRLPEHIHP